MKSIRCLAVLLIIAALPLLAADKPVPPPGVKNASVEQFDKLRSASNTVVLDVRTAKEFQESHIPGAINLDYNAPDFAKKVAQLDKSKTYLVHCAGGRRSVGACAIMDKAAFKNLVNLEDGFRAWEKAAKPVEKK